MSAHPVVRLLILLVLAVPGTLLAQTSTAEPFSEEGYILSNTPTPADAGVVSPVCGAASGTRFNLEPRPNAQAQHTTSIDFLRNRVAAGVDLVIGAALDLRTLQGSQTGYYVSRDSNCAPEFEGALPVLDTTAGPVFGFANPVVAVDPGRDAVFMADERTGTGGFDMSGIGLFRTTGATLLNPSTCPNGTHTAAQASTCWPTRRLSAQRIPGSASFQPSVAVDERTSGIGAG